MKKLLLILSFSAFLMADIMDDGLVAHGTGYHNIPTKSQLKNIVDDGNAALIKGNYQKAFSLYKKACDGGVASGCSKLGDLYKNGEGVEQDYQKAFSFYKKANSFYKKSCDGGNAKGCFSLGLLYADGKGVRQDKAIAKEYYGKACDMGHQRGCDNYKRLSEQGY